MGIGFTWAITFISSIREILGAGTWFGAQIMPAGFEPMAILVRPAGGFIIYGLAIVLMNAVMPKKA